MYYFGKAWTNTINEIPQATDGCHQEECLASSVSKVSGTPYKEHERYL